MYTTVMERDTDDLALELGLDLSIEELEDLSAPGWKYWAGVATGVVVIGGAVAVGIAIT